MATFLKFEDIDAWQKSRELSRQIYEITCSKPFSSDFALKDQIIRSSRSIMDNIAEGFERGGSAEFIHFLTISKGSAGETKSQLYRALGQTYIHQEKFKELYGTCDDIGKMLNGLISYLNKSKIKGLKFKGRN